MERFFLELDPPEQVMRSWPHVVVVGGGFAGLRSAIPSRASQSASR